MEEDEEKLNVEKLIKIERNNAEMNWNSILHRVENINRIKNSENFQPLKDLQINMELNKLLDYITFYKQNIATIESLNLLVENN